MIEGTKEFPMVFRQKAKLQSLFILSLLILTVSFPILCILNNPSLNSKNIENYKVPTSRIEKSEQSEVLGQISGTGSSRPALIITNISDFLRNRDDTTDFSIDTSNWNVSYTKLTFSNITGKNLWKILELDFYSISHFIFLKNATWAMPLTIPTSCYLDTVGIMDFAWALSFQDKLVDVSLFIWNSTAGGLPNKMIFHINFTQLYSFKPFPIVPQLDIFNITNQKSCLLNINLTNMNKFFIGFNCTIVGGVEHTLDWYYDNSGGESYSWTGTAFQKQTDRNMTMQVYLKPLFIHPYPSSLTMRVNSSAVLNNGAGSGLWKDTSFLIPSSSRIFYDITAIWPISYNITYYLTIQNRTRFPVQFLGIASSNFINWNVSIQFQTIPQRMANFTANITVPFNWNQTAPRLIRPNNPSISGGVRTYPAGAYSIFKINADANRWILYCKGQNYLKSITLEKFIGGKFVRSPYMNTTINITDIIRINGTLAFPLTQQTGNLSIFELKGVLNYSESHPMINGRVFFTPFAFDSFTNQSGRYQLQLSWLNGEQVGIKNITLHVLYPTTLIIQSPRTEYIVVGDSINLTVEYANDFKNNKFGETGIEYANATCVFGNFTKNNVYSLNQVGNGYYTTIVPTTSYAQGNYSCKISIGKPDRNNISLSLRIELVFNTSLMVNLYNAELFYGFNISLRVNYSRVDTASGIPGATVKCFVDGKFYASLIDISNGNYSVRINTSAPLFKIYPGIHQVKINATLQKFMSRQIFITFKVNATPTELLLYQNVTRQAGMRFNLTIAFRATNILQGKYLPQSSIRCFLDDAELSLVGTPAQLNNGRFFLIDFNNGTYNIELLINIGKNRTQTDGTPFKVSFIANKTGYLDGTVNGLINIWVWNTSVVFTYWDASVLYRNNVTIKLLYYNTTGKLIDGVISCDFPGNVVIRNIKGNYTIKFNTTGYPAGYTLVKVNITLSGHEWNLTTLRIHIIGTPTLISPYPIIPYSIKINQTLENVILMYNQTNGQSIKNANVEITLSNSTCTFINNTAKFRIFYSYLNGICTIQLRPTGLHFGAYNLTASIENHTVSYAFEPNSTIVLLTIEPLDSYIIPIQAGSWWSAGSLVWYENESISLRIDFNGTFYDLSTPYNDSIFWGHLAFNLYKTGNLIPFTIGTFASQNNGTYLLNLSLNMPISPLYSHYFENYFIQLNGTAIDCQTIIYNITLRYYAKNSVAISINLPNDVIEGESTDISARLTDSFGGSVPNEQVTFTFTITYKSGLQTVLSYEAVTNNNGIATLTFLLPHNIETFIVSAQSKSSVRSLASPTETKNFQTYSTWYYPVRFLKNTWYLFALVITGIVAAYYYLEKYKPKVAKIVAKRETLNYKYVSAVNLLHLLIYDRESKELLFVYSSPGLKITSYLMNSILQSMSMYSDMPVEFQEIYLQDDVCLTLSDAEITRIAVLSKNLPSIEMQKQIQKFIELFERAFKEKIPEAVKNITAVGRFIDLEFANKLVEDCFEKSLTFPHIAIRPHDNVSLTEDENKLHKIAYTLNEKSGPFLLGRLLAKAQMEAGITELPLLIEIVFKLREKGALQSITPLEAEKLKDELMREKLKKTDNSKK